MRPSRTRRSLLTLAVALIATAWFMWLRPVALGGDASYVVVQGESMRPTYEDGDLVLVREETSYHHGDVIAFRAGGPFDDPTRIIHRIVGDAGDGSFRTQGDNRDRLDPWTPGPNDIIGRAVLHVPMVGQAAGLLTHPATLAAVGGTAVVVGGQRRRRRRRPPGPLPGRDAGRVMRHARGTAPATRPGASSGPSRLGRLTHPRWAFGGLIVTGLLAAPVLALSWSALRAPDSTRVIERVGHVDYGIEVDYRFSGAPSAVYPTGTVATTRNAAGAVVPDDPLYSRLLDRLVVDLTFRADEQGAPSLTSTFAVGVDVETPSGWSTTVDSIDAAPFAGTGATSVEIDLRAIALQVAAVGDLTGVGGETYTVVVTPTLELDAASGAGQLREHLTAPLIFAVEDNVITAKAIDRSEREELTRTVDEPATYALGPIDVGTQAARGIVGGLALVIVAGLAWFASVLFGGVGLGEPERIAARYRSQIVDVSAATAPPGTIVMVSAIDELARIAKVEQTVIVHEDLGDGAHRYRVFLGTVTYEYETAPEHAGAASEVAATGADDGG
jgi:signal peptidase I